MFWNVGGHDLSEYLRHACEENDVDILIAAELFQTEAAVLRELNRGRPARPYIELWPNVSKVRLFSRLDISLFEAIFDDGRVSIRSLRQPVGQALLIVAVHLPSKLHATPDEQYYRARQVNEEIRKAETAVGHQNTIVIGDLNMHPFESGVSAADGFHAIADKRIASRISRKFQGKRWDFFYNPMWSRLGDESLGPPGTYFRSTGGLMNHIWATFDQIIIRPSLLPYYVSDQLKVVTEIAGTNLLKNDGRIRVAISDHLPLVIDLKIEGPL